MAKKSLEPKIIGLLHYTRLFSGLSEVAEKRVCWKRDVGGGKNIGAAWVDSGHHS